MRVLGIDCGSQITGFGIVDSDEQNHQLVASGAVRLNPKISFSQKLLRIHHEIDNLIHAYNPEIVAVEDQFYLSNFKSVLKLGQVKGVVLVTAARAGVPIVEYSPLEIKSAVTGYGRAEKSQVQTMVEKLLRLPAPPEPLDASDALALAICHIHTSATQTRFRTAAQAGP
ncbi:MAG: crossover junction endodeoxyribonuclease RuvC [Acidobacteria bacterium]|nr:crossover junction endodeoxyribonuclease RuvC [Acidobacteriota bacterium]MCI0722858.1 crossover junction endodeoxyribonuclease RuvC [Acidobacteriota bacterium]